MALQSTTPLATITLQQATSTVTFSGIPNTYRDLVLVIEGLSNAETFMKIHFNEDSTGANYPNVFMYGSGGGPVSAAGSDSFVGNIYAVVRGLSIVTILDYSATNKHKSVLTRSGAAATTSPQIVIGGALRWTNTNAINSVKILTNASTFASGTSLALYGRIA